MRGGVWLSAGKFQTGGVTLPGSERLGNNSKGLYLGEIFPVVLEDREVWVVMDHPEKNLRSISIRRGTSRDQTFLYFVHRFSICKFLSQTLPHLILSTSIIMPFFIWENGNAERPKRAQPAGPQLPSTGPTSLTWKPRGQMNPHVQTPHTNVGSKFQRIKCNVIERNSRPVWGQKMNGT